MIRWDDAQTIMFTLASETESVGQTFLKLMANQGYKMVLSEFNSEQIEEERTTTAEADVREVQMPVDSLWIAQITLLNGSTKYPLIEVKSRDTWERMTSNDISGIPEYYFVQPRKGIGGSLILLEPIPNDDYTLTMRVETTGKDLSQAAYSTGTVTAALDSDTITGSGTTFTQSMVGRYFRITDTSGDGLWYKIDGYNSATSITLENYYQGSNTAGAAYEIAELFELPEDLHMAPIYYSLWHYFASRRNKEQAAIYQSQYKMMIKDARERWNQKTRDNIIHNFDDSMLGGGSDYPNFFPADGVE